MNSEAVQTSSTSSAITVQFRVVVALVLREVHTLYGNTHLGYVWALIQTAFSMCIFWAIRVALGAHAPYGMSMLVFLLSGFVPWYIFNKSVSSSLNAASANQALLTFPQVTELDIMLARVIVAWGTQLVCGIVLLCIGWSIGQGANLRHPVALAATLFFAPLLGLGMGTLCASLARLWPTLAKILPMFMHILFFISGVFFSVTSFPAWLRDILLFNPMLHIIEWQRSAFASSIAMPLYSIPYITAWCLGSLCLGLLLERYVRGRSIP